MRMRNFGRDLVDSPFVIVQATDAVSLIGLRVIDIVSAPYVETNRIRSTNLVSDLGVFSDGLGFQREFTPDLFL